LLDILVPLQKIPLEEDYVFPICRDVEASFQSFKSGNEILVREMGCKRSHAVAFHLANPAGNIALESVEEVKESYPGLTWVGRIWILPWKFDLWNSLKGLTINEPFT